MKRIQPDLSRAVFMEIPAAIAANHRFVQPEGECEHCGSASDDLVPTSVAGYGEVTDLKLCPVCREALSRADDFVAL